MLSLAGTVGTAVLAAAILSLGGDAFKLRAGQVVSRPIASRVVLKIEDEYQTRLNRQEARDSSPNFYKLDTQLLDVISGRLMNAITLAKAHPDDTVALRDAARANGLELDETGLAELQRMATAADPDRYAQIVNNVLVRLRALPLVEVATAGIRRTATEAVLQDPVTQQEIRKPITGLRFSNDAQVVQDAIAGVVSLVPSTLRESFRATILASLQPESAGQPLRPLYRFDANRSVAVAQAAYENTETVYSTYAPGDVLADAGEITPEERQLLRLEHAEYQQRPASGWAFRLHMLGRSLIAILVVVGVVIYMAAYQQNVVPNHARRAVSAGALLLIFAATRLLFVTTEAPPHLAVGMQALAAGILGIVYAHGAVFAICGGLAILMTMAVGQDIAFCIILLSVSGAMIYGVRSIRNRGKIVVVGGGVALLALLGSFAVGLVAGQRFGFVIVQSLWAAGTTLMAGFIIEGILPGIERVFKLSTGMTLLEWCDASKALMRSLAADAPGTYNHSMLVGTLAEAAAEAIGANGLLCRAGAYYHDIGKINKPHYFVENQTPGISRHDRLSPAMSLLVIIGHVKDGIEMAREYGLPASLHPFIAEHHGTTLVEYFYHAANQARDPNDPVVSDTEFRYPGPKPQSKETAVLMLCDGVEGAVRSMAEPTPNRIEAVVSAIIRKRQEDGQFDECDLTFRELAAIERSLVKSLCGIYHGRIVYPKEVAS